MDFIGLILFALLIYIRPQDFIPALSDERLVVWAMFFTVVAWALGEVRRRTTRFPSTAIDWWLCCLLVVAVVSTVEVRWLAYTQSVAVILSKNLLFFLMVSLVLNTRERVGGFLAAILLFTSVMCSLACLLPFGIDVFGVGMVGENRIQGPGIFQNPNYLAYGAIFPMPIAFGLLVRQKGILKRIAGGVLLAVLGLTVALTKSRGGMIAMLVVLSYVMVQRRHVRVRWIAGVVAAAGVFLLMRTGVARMGTLSDMRADAAIFGRIDSWYAGFLMLKSSPLIGIGYGNYLSYFHLAAHSSFVQVVCETGLIGLFLWSGVLFHAFRGVRAAWRKQAGDERHLLTVEGMLVAYCMTGFFATMGYYITLFIGLGLANALVRNALALSSAPEELQDLATPGFRLRDIAAVSCVTGGILIMWRVLMRLIG